MAYIEKAVEYLEQKHKVYRKLLADLGEWKMDRTRTIAEIERLINFIDDFHKNANVVNLVGSSAGAVGAGAVILAPFTGGISLAVGGLVVGTVGASTTVAASFKDSSITKENCKKAQQLMDNDSQATSALLFLLEEYHTISNSLRCCLKQTGSNDGAVSSAPRIMAGTQVASKYFMGSHILVHSAKAVKHGAKASRALPILTVASLAIDIWSIITTSKDMVEGSKTTAGKELSKVVEELQQQQGQMQEAVEEVVRIETEVWSKALAEAAVDSIGGDALSPAKLPHQTPNKFNDEDLENEEEAEGGEKVKRLRICLMNVHSVFSKWAEINSYIMRNSIDVLAVTQNYDRKESLESLSDGYKVFVYSPRDEGRPGAGVGALVRDDIKAGEDTFPFDSFECIKCELTVALSDDKSEELDIYIVYRPSSSPASGDDDLESFLDQFENLLAFSDPDRKMVILGDFNINCTDSDSPGNKKMKVLLEKHNLVQHVNEKTTEGDKTFDLVITPCDTASVIRNLHVDKSIRDYMSLTHFPVLFTLTLKGC